MPEAQSLHKHHQHSKMEVMDISASNLPNVRRLPGGRTRAVIKLEGPLSHPYELPEEGAEGFNPRWEDSFTVALNNLQRNLKISVLTRRTGRSKKLIGSVLVPLSDFADCTGLPCVREYILDCNKSNPKEHNHFSINSINSDDDEDDDEEDGDNGHVNSSANSKLPLPTLRIRAKLL